MLFPQSNNAVGSIHSGACSLALAPRQLGQAQATSVTLTLFGEEMIEPELIDRCIDGWFNWTCNKPQT